MLSIDFIRENKDKVKEAAENKNQQVDIDGIISLDEKRRKLISEIQALREDRNKIVKEKNIEKGKEIKSSLKKFEDDLKKTEDELKPLLYSIPNIPKKDVKIGKDESGNEVVRKNKEPVKFKFQPRDHLALGELLQIIDIERASKVSGSRFTYLKNEGAVLEIALVQLAFEVLMKEGFKPIIPPALIKTDVMKELGYMEGEGADDMFHIEKDGLTLVGTAEHSIVPYHKDEILDKKLLPLRYVGFTTSFRRESGSYGKDVRGIFRVHQFDKVEMVSFVTKDDDDKEHEYLLSLEEKLFQTLDVPYQVVKMCTGDLGFPVARKYDIEAWIPSQSKYREVTSASTTTDFQARRLNIKYREGEQKEYVHILNGTAFSTNRPIITILENHQQEDGTVLIPKALQKYTGFDKITPK